MLDWGWNSARRVGSDSLKEAMLMNDRSIEKQESGVYESMNEGGM